MCIIFAYIIYKPLHRKMCNHHFLQKFKFLFGTNQKKLNGIFQLYDDSLCHCLANGFFGWSGKNGSPHTLRCIRSRISSHTHAYTDGILRSNCSQQYFGACSPCPPSISLAFECANSGSLFLGKCSFDRMNLLILFVCHAVCFPLTKKKRHSMGKSCWMKILKILQITTMRCFTE